jgi:predicted transcriptional regulator
MSIATFALHTIRRATRAALLVIHHTGWNQDHERGHSILRGTCRVVVRIEAREDGLIRMVCEKKNQGRKFDPRSFRLVEAGTKGDVTPLPAYMVMAGRLRLTDRLIRILEALTTEPLRNGATHTDLKNDSNMPAGTLNRALTVLSDAGYIYADLHGKTIKYKLSKQGRDVLDMVNEEQNGGWKSSGRILEEGGRDWNWQIASSTDLEHTGAILPNASTILPTTPEYIYPTDIYSGLDTDTQNPSTGFRDVDWFSVDAAAEDDEPLFPETEVDLQAELELEAQSAPDGSGLIARLRARQEGEAA